MKPTPEAISTVEELSRKLAGMTHEEFILSLKNSPPGLTLALNRMATQQMDIELLRREQRRTSYLIYAVAFSQLVYVIAWIVSK